MVGFTQYFGYLIHFSRAWSFTKGETLCLLSTVYFIIDMCSNIDVFNTYLHPRFTSFVVCLFVFRTWVSEPSI